MLHQHSEQRSWWKLVLTGFLAIAFGIGAVVLPAGIMFGRILDVIFGVAKPLSASMTAVAAVLALVALVAVDSLVNLFGTGVMDKRASRIRGVDIGGRCKESRTARHRRDRFDRHWRRRDEVGLRGCGPGQCCRWYCGRCSRNQPDRERYSRTSYFSRTGGTDNQAQGCLNPPGVHYFAGVDRHGYRDRILEERRKTLPTWKTKNW
jgi:hypothetical protein